MYKTADPKTRHKPEKPAQSHMEVRRLADAVWLTGEALAITAKLLRWWTILRGKVCSNAGEHDAERIPCETTAGGLGCPCAGRTGKRFLLGDLIGCNMRACRTWVGLRNCPFCKEEVGLDDARCPCRAEDLPLQENMALKRRKRRGVVRLLRESGGEGYVVVHQGGIWRQELMGRRWTKTLD